MLNVYFAAETIRQIIRAVWSIKKFKDPNSLLSDRGNPQPLMK